ncbi:glycogen synthase GlgA [candidate division KSB1 bacterium]
MKKLKILFVSTEIYPFAKTGGLADVSSALPKALKDLGHEIRVIMPKYKFINERKYILREVIRLRDIEIPLGTKTKTLSVKSAFIPDSKVQVYFVDSKEYFGRMGIYVDPKKKKDYPDNADRFIVFSRAVLETLKRLLWAPDVVHCNDWQSALVMYYLRTVYQEEPLLSKAISLLSIHNLGFQGNFPKNVAEKAGIDKSEFTPGSAFEYFDKFSFLKTGINYADIVNTVSKKYAEEIQESEEYGFGFEGLLRSNKKKLFGILNGIDYSVWNPETDEYIEENYSIKSISRKKDNKIKLLEEAGLKYDENVPLIGMISRLVDQKGFDLIDNAKKELAEMNAQFIVLGTGEEKYHKMFKGLKKKYPDKFAVFLSYDEALAHKIEAGADMFLMPSKYEPCGLNQMISLKYGTVPIVRLTGGLADTIKNYNPKTGEGNGFTFLKYSEDEMIKAVKHAIKLFEDNKEWIKFVKKGMKTDFSWSKSAKNYTKLYEQTIKAKIKK